MTLVDLVRQAGVVGAGGGGFPTHVKLTARGDTVVANGAECEPLLHKDAAVMERLSAQVVAGMQAAMEAVGAKDGVVGIKGKKKHAVEAMQEACAGTPVRVHLLEDYYPAGDEVDLVYETTGRRIPPGGIPIQVGVIVCNVETLANIAAAAQGIPVTHKTLTLAGAVRHPVTLTVPVGTSFREVIQAAGGLTTEDVVLCVGGLMMGEATDDLDTPIVKTTTGAVILPRDHHVIQRKLKSAPTQARIGKSACDQCRYCTELCPRYLLGYAVEPHQVMRSLAFTATDKRFWNPWAALCCRCGLCTLYACPEGLYPKEACDASKEEMGAAGVRWTGSTSVTPHPMREGRHTPVQALMRKLQVQEYDVVAPYEDRSVVPDQVVLPLKQGAGVPNTPLVGPGDRVAKGQPLGEVPEGALGAMIHTPFAGIVTEVANGMVRIQRQR